MTARDPETDLRAMLAVLGHADESDRPAGRDDAYEEAVAHWSEMFEPLTAIARPVRAPDRLWTRIEASLRDGTRRTEAAKARGREPFWKRLWSSVDLWRFTAAGAATAAILLALFGRAPIEGTRGPAFVAVLQAPEGDRNAGFLVEVAADRSVRLVPLKRTEVAADKALQFWTLADKAKGPHSLGLVTDTDVTALRPGALPSVTDGQLFEITLEPATGSPIGRPTGPILYKGLTSKTS